MLADEIASPGEIAAQKETLAQFSTLQAEMQEML